MSDLSQPTEKTPKVKEGEILLVKQDDGNWKGYMTREGNPLEVRMIDPYTCLLALLTHA